MTTPSAIRGIRLSPIGLTPMELSILRGALSIAVGGVDEPDAAERATAGVVAVLARLARERLGAAPGSSAIQRNTGRVALRYFDPNFNCLRWIVYDDPSQNELRATRVDELSTISAYNAWDVTEADWGALVWRTSS